MTEKKWEIYQVSKEVCEYSKVKSNKKRTAKIGMQIKRNNILRKKKAWNHRETACNKTTK